VFTHVRKSVIGGNQAALAAAARFATRMRVRRVVVDERPLTGEAVDAGRAIARAALAAEPGTCVVLGGETTVTLPDSHGTGGRNQQFALAAAEVLHAAGHTGRPVVILAAGTDGRDGPTDAAGALVTNDSWSRILGAGLDPGAHLARCDAYPALDAARSLERTGPTGTNVADIVVVLTG
jgi:glycerate-2-kinase